MEKLKIDLKESKDATAKAKRKLKEVCTKRYEVLKCMSQMEMNTALQIEQLKAALDSLSYPSFVF